MDKEQRMLKEMWAYRKDDKHPIAMETNAGKHIIVGIVATLVALGLGFILGQKVKRCSECRDVELTTEMNKWMSVADSLNDRTIILEAEANMLRDRIDSLAAARPTPKTSVRNALRFVNSASFNTVVDSVLAVPE